MRSSSIALFLVLFLWPRWACANESWFGQEKSNVRTLTINCLPEDVSVYCPNFEFGKRSFLHRGGAKQLKLKSGVYRFIFSKPLYEVVTKDIDLTHNDKKLIIHLDEQGPFSCPRRIIIKVKGIFHTPRRQSAIIMYEGEWLRVDKGYVSKDGVFRVIDVTSDHVKIQSMTELPPKTFYF